MDFTKYRQQDKCRKLAEYLNSNPSAEEAELVVEQFKKAIYDFYQAKGKPDAQCLFEVARYCGIASGQVKGSIPSNLKTNEEETAKARGFHDRKKTDKEVVEFEVNITEMLEIAKELLLSPLPAVKAIGVQAATGRRISEVFEGEFSPIEGKDYSIAFKGQKKKRGSDPASNAIYFIPSLLPAKDVIKAARFAKDAFKDEIAGRKRFNDSDAYELSQEAFRQHINYSTDRKERAGSHILRDIYCSVLDDLLKPKYRSYPYRVAYVMRSIGDKEGEAASYGYCIPLNVPSIPIELEKNEVGMQNEDPTAPLFEKFEGKTVAINDIMKALKDEQIILDFGTELRRSNAAEVIGRIIRRYLEANPIPQVEIKHTPQVPLNRPDEQLERILRAIESFNDRTGRKAYIAVTQSLLERVRKEKWGSTTAKATLKNFIKKYQDEINAIHEKHGIPLYPEGEAKIQAYNHTWRKGNAFQGVLEDLVESL